MKKPWYTESLSFPQGDRIGIQKRQDSKTQMVQFWSPLLTIVWQKPEQHKNDSIFNRKIIILSQQTYKMLSMGLKNI